ncbi:MAG: hypothetical protein EKK61_01290 [Rickettsiales bacterium]|nr:MAG: hypothetical protein EKK61_01290 [Rickettsiales bacterium]
MTLSSDKIIEINHATQKAMQTIFDNANIENSAQHQERFIKILQTIDDHKIQDNHFANLKQELEKIKKMGINVDFMPYEAGGFIDRDKTVKKIETIYSLDGPQVMEMLKEKNEKFKDRPNARDEMDAFTQAYMEKHGTPKDIEKDDYKKMAISLSEIKERVNQKAKETNVPHNINFAVIEFAEDKMQNTVDEFQELIKSSPQIAKLTPQITELIQNYTFAAVPNQAPKIMENIQDIVGKETKDRQPYRPVDDYTKKNKEKIISDVFNDPESKINLSIKRNEQKVKNSISELENFIEDNLSQVGNVKTIYTKVVKLPIESVVIQKNKLDGDKYNADIKMFDTAIIGLEKLEKHCNQLNREMDKKFDDYNHKSEQLKGGAKIVSSLLKVGGNLAKFNLSGAKKQLTNIKDTPKKLRNKLAAINNLPNEQDNITNLLNQITEKKKEIISTKNCYINDMAFSFDHEGRRHYIKDVQSEMIKANKTNNFDYFLDKVNKVANPELLPQNQELLPRQNLIGNHRTAYVSNVTEVKTPGELMKNNIQLDSENSVNNNEKKPNILEKIRNTIKNIPSTKNKEVPVKTQQSDSIRKR